MKSKIAITIGVMAGAMLLSTAANAMTKADCKKAGGSWVTVYIGGKGVEGCSIPMLLGAERLHYYAEHGLRFPGDPLPSNRESHDPR